MYTRPPLSTGTYAEIDASSKTVYFRSVSVDPSRPRCVPKRNDTGNIFVRFLSLLFLPSFFGTAGAIMGARSGATTSEGNHRSTRLDTSTAAPRRHRRTRFQRAPGNCWLQVQGKRGFRKLGNTNRRIPKVFLGILLRGWSASGPSCVPVINLKTWAGKNQVSREYNSRSETESRLCSKRRMCVYLRNFRY